MPDFANGWCPTPPLAASSSWRMNVAQYGDGYEQRQLDGINALTRTWDVEYATRQQGTILEMDAYLVVHKAGAFPFLDPVTQIVHQVTCDEWSIDWNLVKWDGRGLRTVYGTLTATFKKSNGLTVTTMALSPTVVVAPAVTSSDGLVFAYAPGAWRDALAVGHEWLVDGATTGEHGPTFDAPGPGHVVTVIETAISRGGITTAHSAWPIPLPYSEVA